MASNAREVARNAGRPSVVLLVEDGQGGLMAVRFPTAGQARAWEDAHPEVEGRGVARYVSSHEALREARGNG